MPIGPQPFGHFATTSNCRVFHKLDHSIYTFILFYWLLKKPRCVGFTIPTLRIFAMPWLFAAKLQNEVPALPRWINLSSLSLAIDMIWYDLIDLIWFDWFDWFDMIWYDLIWFDMIWYDLIDLIDLIWFDWFDMIWLIWYVLIWFDWFDMIWLIWLIWYDFIWFDMIWYDLIWFDWFDWFDMIWLIWYDLIDLIDLIWFDMIWYDLIWFDMIWYDLIWFDMIWLIWYDLIWFDWFDMIWYETNACWWRIALLMAKALPPSLWHLHLLFQTLQASKESNVGRVPVTIKHHRHGEDMLRTGLRGFE